MSNGNMLCSLQRTGKNEWYFKARNYYTQNTRSTAKIKRFIAQVIHNNYNEIKIGEDGDFLINNKNNRQKDKDN